MPRFTAHLALSCLLFTGTAAHAADDTQASTTAPADKSSQAGDEPQDQLLKAAGRDTGSGWLFGGGLAVTDPGYLGYNRQVTPIPLIFYHNGRFFFAGITAGYLLSNGDHYRFSLVVLPQFNRLSASDSPQLAGIQTRQWSLDGGANVDLFGGWGRFNLGVAHDLLDRNNGTGANVGYHYSFRLGDWTLTPGLGIRWESANLTNYYYGVSPAETIPGRPAYSPGSATNPFVDVSVSTAISEHWQFRGYLQYMHFASAIHDSPIVDRSGSPTIFIGFVYNPQENYRGMQGVGP
ncbi:MAG TPA: MipA/OmpV family protein [Gammaproteobacteria bacterium]|nr:MipA/OmpV family protein [Gammaproteobacteria bacterium]